MPMTELPPDAHVMLIFKGFVITRIADGGATAIMDGLRDSACHDTRIKMIEITAAREELRFEQFDPKKPISLQVFGPKFPRIQVFQKDNLPFDRLDDVNNFRKDFRWFTDLSKLHKKPLKVNPKGINPIITVDNGLFYSTAKSEGEVRVKRLDAQGNPLPPERLGKFATGVSGNIYLKDKDSKVVFKNGGKKITLNRTSQYVMSFDCTCDVNPEESDFPLVYQAIGTELQGKVVPLPDLDRVELVSDPLPGGPTPGGETYCLGGNVS